MPHRFRHRWYVWCVIVVCAAAMAKIAGPRLWFMAAVPCGRDDVAPCRERPRGEGNPMSILPRARASPPRFAPGQLIVQYRDEIAVPVDVMMRQGLGFAAAGLAPARALALDALHERLRVRAARPLGPATEATELPLPAQFARRLDRLDRGAGRGLARHPAGKKDAALALQRRLVRTYALALPDDADVEEAARRLADDPSIAYAAPDYLVAAAAESDDPAWSTSGSWEQPYEDLWNLRRIDLPEAWETNQGLTADGRPAVVAVVDTGLDLTHLDLVDNIFRNAAEIPDNGIDDDANGYVDDARGWDFVQCRRFRFDGTCLAAAPNNDPTDRNGHGTHVASVVAAVADNGLGIAGVAPSARIMPLRALNKQGYGLSSWLAEAMAYAALNGADVINNSWGCINCPSNPVLEDAVRFVRALGVTVVMAAGNDDRDVSGSSPQNTRQTITVGACTQSDARAVFSNFGHALDLCAPGGGDFDAALKRWAHNVLGARARRGRFPHGLAVRALSTNKRDRYVRLGGTSIAAPHVAGAAALVMAHRPAFSPDDVRAVLRAAADDVHTPALDIFTGAGRLNVARTLPVDSVLDVAISSPAPGAQVDPAVATVAITGTAAGPDFVSYTLSYGRGRAPTEWVPIAGPVGAPVTGGLLGTWRLAREAGLFTIRLAARTRAGLDFQDLTQVFVERPPRRIAPSDFVQLDPRLDGDIVVWTERAATPSNIRVHDLRTGRTWWMLDDAYARIWPDVSFPYLIGLIWQPKTSSWDVFEHDLRAQGTRLVTDDALHELPPRTDGTWDVWLAYEEAASASFHVYAHHRPSGEVRRLTDDRRTRANVRVSNGVVVWEQLDRFRPIRYIQAYRLDTNTTWKLTETSETDQFHPAIDYPIVVWNEQQGTTRIRAHDLETGETWWVTPAMSGSQWLPDIAGHRIVCLDSEHGVLNVRTVDVRTGGMEWITSHPLPQYSPVIGRTADGWRIAWTDTRWVDATGATIWQIAVRDLDDDTEPPDDD